MVDEVWDDYNRFNQSGFSAPTVFPEEGNYSNKFLFLEDIEKAERREMMRQEIIAGLNEERGENEL